MPPLLNSVPPPMLLNAVPRALIIDGAGDGFRMPEIGGRGLRERRPSVRQLESEGVGTSRAHQTNTASAPSDDEFPDMESADEQDGATAAAAGSSRQTTDATANDPLAGYVKHLPAGVSEKGTFAQFTYAVVRNC